MKYNVYVLLNQKNIIIYVGYTNNINRRFKEHQRYIKNIKSKKFLYKQCRLKKWIIKIKRVKEFNNSSSAKLYESYLICKQIIEEKNLDLTNKQIDKSRLFVNLYLEESLT